MGALFVGLSQELDATARARKGDPTYFRCFHVVKNMFYWRGMYFSLFFFFSPLLASCFLASRLLDVSAFGLFVRLLVAFSLWLFASSAFPVPLRQVAL